MGPTVEQIEGQIDRTRDRLASNLDEFERRFDAATDWREYFRARPFTFLGAAVAGGAVAALVFGKARPNGEYRSPNQQSNEAMSGLGVATRLNSPAEQASKVWNNLKCAAVSLAAARLKEYVDSFLPGFDEHYQRAERS
jgi:Protein of unknown function (DUF3618)